MTVGTTAVLGVSDGYDGNKRLETASSPQHGAFTYRYHPGSGIVSGYSGWGGDPPALMIDQSRPVDFQNRVSSVRTKNGASQTITSIAYTHDQRDRRTRATREDGSYWAYGYNDRGELTSGKRHAVGGAAINGLERAYQYDSIGNR